MVFVIAAAESLPFELKNIADSISILFPWGTLLEYVIKPNRDILSNVADLAKNEAHFEFVTTYSDSYEEAEIKKRGLPLLSKAYFLSEQYKAELSNSGFRIDDVKELDNEYVKQFNSLWTKRLAFGRKRSFEFLAMFQNIKNDSKKATRRSFDYEKKHCKVVGFGYSNFFVFRLC